MAFNAIVLSKMNAFKLKYEWPDDGMMHLKKSRKDLPCSRRDMHGYSILNNFEVKDIEACQRLINMTMKELQQWIPPTICYSFTFSAFDNIICAPNKLYLVGVCMMW